MMSAIESTSAFDALLAPTGNRYARRTPVALKLSARAAAVVAKLRELAPYALIELVLPGGSVMALLLWLYRRQKRISGSRRDPRLVRGVLGVDATGAVTVGRGVIGMQPVRTMGNVEADARSLA
jgi:hypothetical protein